MTVIPTRAFRVRAVLFDFDGTLTRPGSLDFAVFKRSIGCPENQPALEFIESLPDPDRRKAAFAALVDFEMASAEKSRPNQGAEETVVQLRSQGLRVGILSRNCRRSIQRALENFAHIGLSDFDVLISRDDPMAPKPSPAGVLIAAQRLEVDPSCLMVVGDYRFDVQAGHSAGAVTVFLRNNGAGAPAPSESDFAINSLSELVPIVGFGMPLPAGKLPNPMLEDFIGRLPVADPTILIRPGVGEDVAAVDVNESQVILLKSDPITFATDSIGLYAVLVNANDIATSGGTPRWFLATLLLPSGTTPSMVWQTLSELQRVCGQWGITLCGGHTEITDAVTRPVVAGTLVGTVARENLVQKQRMQTGDCVIMTKGIAVEGTAIIAREFGRQLRELGVPQAQIDAGRRFLDHISIVPEARLAAAFPGVSAMHDVTEGGLATALEELSIAGRHRIAVERERIPVFPETEGFCRRLGIEPLGLIASGSLLICCRPEESDRLVAAIRTAGTEATAIGRVVSPGRGIDASRDGKAEEWPQFDVDEITGCSE